MIFSTTSTKALIAAVEHLGTDDLLQELLVPVDFSACSDNAIRYAVAIALRTGARIKLFHSVSLPLTAPDMGAYPIDAIEREAARKLGDKAAEIQEWLDRERLRKIDVKHHVHVGFVAEEVVNQASHSHTDLIVMGTHGADYAGGNLLGSNAALVLQRVKCPVLVVPADAAFTGFHKIAYASDMQEVNRPAVKMLVDFAGHFDAEVHVLHFINHKQDISTEAADQFKDQFAKAAHYAKVSYHVVESDLPLAEALSNYVEEEGLDAVAMLTHDRSLFGRIFHPSQTKRVALHSHKPLLAFH